MRQAKIAYFFPSRWCQATWWRSPGSAQMARLALMFCAMKGGPIVFRASMTHDKKYAPKRNDFVVKTSLSCRGKRIS